MKLPWEKNDRIGELEDKVDKLESKIEDLKSDKNDLAKRFEAEKERRSKLSAEKQEAEEKLKKLEQKIEASSDSKETEKSPAKEIESRKISVKKAKRIFSKLNSIKSEERDLTTIYITSDLNSLKDLKALKSTLNKENYLFLSKNPKNTICFLEPDFLKLKIKSRPLYKPKWTNSRHFELSEVKKIISSHKTWAIVSAGQTILLEEEDGRIKSREEIKSRVDKKQKKGGFSQKRFERKRQEQIEEHLDLVREKINQETLLVGEKQLCDRLNGTYLGGYDDEGRTVDELYNFRLVLNSI